MSTLPESPAISQDVTAGDSDDRQNLCNLIHETDTSIYRLFLVADVSSVSLEGMNRFLITVSNQDKESRLLEKMYADLEINLRQAMSCISIAGGNPHYFSVTGRSLDLDDEEIDSSIHEAVDMGMMDFRIRSGVKPTREVRATSIMFDDLSCNLLKGSISALLAQATHSHRAVILNAGHIFASRQDYIRDMCTSMGRQANTMALSIINKALTCDQGMF